MKPEKLAFDMSSFIWRGLLAGKDPEGKEVLFEDKKVWVNSAGHGYENCVSMMLTALKIADLTPIDAILVFEGMNSKARRRFIASSYKETRESRPPEAYEAFHIVREKVEALWKSVGAMACSQDYVEGDDVLGWLAENARWNLMVATFDNDLIVLQSEKDETNAHGARIDVQINEQVGINKYGIFPYKLTTTYKALVGDDSDNIKGCPGFGKGAFNDFLEAYGFDGLQELQDLLEAGSLEPLHEMANEQHNIGKRVEKWKSTHPLIQKIIENEEAVITSYKLAKLHPEWCHTMKDQISFRPGIVLPFPANGDERLRHWHQQKVLVTADNYEDALYRLGTWLNDSPFSCFDIETSSADESDDWLAAQGDPDGVDQMGSTLTGFSITCGRNMHRTLYVSVDHADTNNITMSQARRMVEKMTGPVATTVNGLECVVHNSHFELPVLYCAADEDGTLWRDHWKDNGFHGFLPNVLDTKLEASYQNENHKLGLKDRSQRHFGYKQTDYDMVTKLVGPALLPGGKHLGYMSVIIEPEVTELRPVPADDPDYTGEGCTRHVVVKASVLEAQEVRRYKMNQLPATHVFDYGCDDTICTAAGHVFYKFILDIEGTYELYKEVEIAAAYQHAKNFVDGIEFSLERCKELERLDDEVYNSRWAVVREYLIGKGWDGVTPPVYTKDIKLAEIKQACEIAMGDTLDTMVRTPSKIVKLLQADGELVFSAMLARCIESDEGAAEFTQWVQSHFKGEPIFNMDSPKQMTHLLYEVMALPIQVRNKPTDIMKQKGLPGNPKTDELALKYAMRDATPEIKEVLESIWLCKMVLTRRELYYSKYPYFVHWKTGRIHPSHNQCGTNTRRASESKPNKQQLPKHAKVELALLTDDYLKAAVLPRFRETIVPHRHDAVVVSMDFQSQEQVVIANYSKDENLVACFVGETKKGLHSLTGVGIAMKREPNKGWNYDLFEEIRIKADLDKEFAATPAAKAVKIFRALGKKTNFVAEYGAMAPKVAATLMVTEEEAQEFLDAREDMFPGVKAWKLDVIAEVKEYGYVTTMLGARRHLRDALQSDDRFEASKAERQAINFKVQGSSGEMTKLAESRMWMDALFFEFDAVCYGPIHDEVVASVVVDERFPEFIRRMHEAMVADYAGMEIPIESSISFGPSFGEQFEIGSMPSPEAVAEGLAAIEKAREKVAA